MKRSKLVVPFLLVALAAFLAAGCASTAKQEQEPEPVTEEVTEAPAEPNEVRSIKLDAWSVEVGGSTSATVRGTEGRSVSLELTGASGEAAGSTRSVSLSESQDGTYTGRVEVGSGMPPGRYRVRARMSGAEQDEASLVSDRALMVMAPEPETTACEELSKMLQRETEIYFDFDRDELKPEGEAYLRKVSRMVQRAESAQRLTVEGHCDERGTIEYNLALGARRAGSVRSALEEMGVEVPVETISRGEEQPVIPNARTEAEHAKNRRAVLSVTCR